MTTTQTQNPKSYRLSFIWLTSIGSFMLLLSLVGNVLESIFPQMQGTLAFGFLFTAIVCLFVASVHYAKYLSLKK